MSSVLGSRLPEKGRFSLERRKQLFSKGFIEGGRRARAGVAVLGR
jgi:hypothetical protein